MNTRLPEQRLWDSLRKALQLWGFTYARIESHATAPGFPDLVLRTKGGKSSPFFLELKVMEGDDWVPMVHWTAQQRTVAQKWCPYVWMLVKFRTDYVLFCGNGMLDWQLEPDARKLAAYWGPNMAKVIETLKMVMEMGR